MKELIIAFFKKVWDVVKKIFRAIVKLADVLSDLSEIATGVAKAFNIIVVAVKSGLEIIECVFGNGKIIDYETNSQIVQTEKIENGIFENDIRSL